MAEVSFYTLRQAGSSARLRQACALTEQAFLAGERVLVWLEDAAAQDQFDQLLWTFSDRSFVPHEPLGADPAQGEAPVQLHAGPALDARVHEAGFSTLLNLRSAASPDALRFRKVLEVIDAEPATRNAGRERFRYYREQGSTPQHFEVNS